MELHVSMVMGDVPPHSRPTNWFLHQSFGSTKNLNCGESHKPTILPCQGIVSGGAKKIFSIMAINPQHNLSMVGWAFFLLTVFDLQMAFPLTFSGPGRLDC